MASQTQFALSRAVELFRGGQLADAAGQCTEILRTGPESFDALHLLGAIRGKQGKLGEAVELFNRAAALNPGSFEVHKNLGLALGRLGQSEAAVASYRRAVAVKPEAAGAWVELGNACRALKREAEAADSYRRALAIRPDDANTHNSLGNTLKALGQSHEAIACYRRALALAPNAAAVHYNLGVELELLGQLGEASECYRRAVALKPDFAEAHNNLGNVLAALQRHDAAIESYRRAIGARSNYAQAHYNLGITLKALNRHDEAIACFQAAGSIAPDFANAHWNESLTRLGAGDFAGGWSKYEWRWKRGDSRLNKRDFAQPVWLGKESLAGKTILLHAEQGIGDTIQFSRYAPLVAKLGANVVLEVQPAIKRLIASIAGVPPIIAKGEPLPDFDFHCPMLSLPLAMGTTVVTIPGTTPYLHAPPDLVAAARAKLHRWHDKLLVGLAWRGNKAQRSDSRRSMALTELAPLLNVPGARFLSLQKELSDEERGIVERTGCVTHLGEGFEETAALVAALDLVISVDTAWAHWAGAIGKPVWVMLAFSPDWRWLREREDSPWYPTARLFRQPRLGDWAGAVERATAALDAFIKSRPARPPIDVSDQPTLGRAVELYRAGDRAAAAALCARLLEREPENFDALHLLGVVKGALGQLDESRAVFERAVAVNPKSAQAHRNLAIAFAKLGRHDDAIASYGNAIAVKPDYAAAHNGLGGVLNALHRPAEAETSFRRAVAINPLYFGAWVNLGHVLTQLGRHEEAAASFRSAIAIKPQDAGPHNDLGNALKALNRNDEAIASYQSALAIMPDLAEVHYNLGVALESQQRADEAEACYRRALAIKPDLAEANNNLGNRIGSLGRHDEAVELYRRAIAARQDYAEAHYNLGIALLKLNRHDESIASFDRAIAAHPDYGNAHWNQSLALLGAGNFADGWRKYEWRYRRAGLEAAARNFSVPLWLGDADIAGKTILLHAEQGLGDTIQFVRFVPEIARRGARVLLEVQPALKRLVAGIDGVAKIVGRGEPLPVVDCHCPLMSLPLALGVTALESIPARVPYLRAPPDLVRKAGAELRRTPGEFLVGLTWKGNQQNRGDRLRSIALDQLVPRLAVPGVRFVSLQKELTDEERGIVERSGCVTHPGASFEDTAAMVEVLDLVISVDTSWAHWAGAANRPVWILLAFSPDWRWLRDREDSPWYPTARLFRQGRSGDWDDVLGRIRVELERIVGVRRGRPSSPARNALLRAVELHRQGRLDEAAEHCAKLLESRPDDFDVVHLAGVISGEQGRLEDAASHLGKAAALNPNSVQVLRNLGIAQEKLKRYDAAIDSYRAALAIEPGAAEAHLGLANSLLALGRHEEAVDGYRKAIAARPDLVNAHTNLSAALAHLGRHDEAVETCRKALAIDPARAETHSNLGNALHALGRNEEALASFQSAIAIRPDDAEAYNSMANVYAALKRFDAAATCYEKALALAPSDPNALGGLAHAKQRICDWRDADRIAAAVLDHVRTQPSPIAPFNLLGIADDPEVQLACARRSWSGTTIKRSFGAARSADRGRKLRLGYLSADFHAHATGHLMAGLFETHDRSRFELYAFSHGPDDSSPMRRRLQRSFDGFIEVRRASDEEIAKQIFDRGIDILVDLKGYTGHNRLRVLAQRPAPVQVHYLGFPGTLGTDFVDYMIVDRFVVPSGHERYFAEKLVYLPDSYQVNDRNRSVADRALSRTEFGLPDAGFVFCCFSNNYKMAPEIFAVWLRLLHAVPGSVLWLLADNQWAAANLRREAQAAGVDSGRVIFAPRVGPAEHLARHRLADLFLDTLPVNAHTTASDALWVGLPLLTCAGRSFAARVAGSLLRAVGLPELITFNLADYEALALRLASEPGTLAGLRQKLAENRMVAPLFDTDRTRRQIETAYLIMWENWCRGEPPRSFAVE